MISRTQRAGAGGLRAAILVVTTSGLLGGCVTSRLEQARQAYTGGMNEGEAVVLLTRRFNNQRETEEGFTECVRSALAAGDRSMEMRNEQEFLDGLFPWFEPRHAPTRVEDLPNLLAMPGVPEKIAQTGVRYIVWLDGETETVDGGGSISCDIGGFGCVGFQWWERDSSYEASIWDLKTITSAGIITADVTGTSYMPAIVLPIPIIARTRAAACRGLAGQIKEFLVLAEPEQDL